MEIDKKELKIISYDFRCISSRLINANWRNSMAVLKMFIDYIDNNELIYEFIKSKQKTEDDCDYSQYMGSTFESLGDTPNEEILFIYGYLKYGSEHFGDYYTGFALRYSSGGAGDSVKEFNNRVVIPFVNYIEQYLTKIGIHMGYDEEAKYMITINNHNGQVNVSQDSSALNAVQNQRVDISELDNIIQNIKSLITDDISAESRALIEENTECIREELQKESPRKGLIKTCIDGMKTFANTITISTELATSIYALVEFASKIIK